MGQKSCDRCASDHEESGPIQNVCRVHPRNGGQDKNVAVDVSGCAAPGTVQGHIRADTTSDSVTEAVASGVRRERHGPSVSTDTPLSAGSSDGKRLSGGSAWEASVQIDSRVRMTRLQEIRGGVRQSRQKEPHLARGQSTHRSPCPVWVSKSELSWHATTGAPRQIRTAAPASGGQCSIP